MGILTRPRFLPQQRLDLEDVNALLSALRTDSKLQTKQFVSSTNLILKGFSVTGVGLKSATVAMADATLVIPQNTTDFSWFTSSPTEANIVIPDADLTDGTRNYVEIELQTENNTPLTKAFWDPEANSGTGSEFNQIVDTVTDLNVAMIVSTGGFSGSPDRLPLCIIDTDGSGNIKTILDRRNLMFRLGKTNDIGFSYVWGTRGEPGYAAVLTSVTGTFVAGEELTINTETAKCTVGGTTSITFNEPTGINFFPGSTVTGVTSGATGTLSTVAESFSGADKSIKSYKDMFDALMTEIKLIKGTDFWHTSNSSSLAGIVKQLESIMTQATATATFKWDGSALHISDGNGSPADADVLGYIRMMGRSENFGMTRQDGTGSSSTLAIADGQVLFVKIPSVGPISWSGLGTGNTNFQVVDIGSYQPSDEVYWLAYRQGAKLYLRGYGELESGEIIPIGDPAIEDIIASVAATDARVNQDRNVKLIEGGTWSYTTGSLVLSADAYVQIPGLPKARNTIAAQTISLPNAKSVAYVSLNRSGTTTATLAVTVADDDAITLTDDMLIIARRTTAGVIVGTHSFLLKTGERLEMDGALAEINRYFGQLRIKEHPSLKKRVQITGSDQTLLDGTVLSQSLRNLLLAFEGAEIDFSTGTVYAADGVAALGINFTPISIPTGEYAWYSITLVASSINSVENTITAQLLVLPAESTGVTSSLAPLAPFASGTQLGQVQVQESGGTIANISQSSIRQLGVGSGSGGGGTGDANELLERIKEQFQDSSYEFVTPVIFSTAKETLSNEGNTTGTYSVVSDLYELQSGQKFESIDLIDDMYRELLKDISKISLVAYWKNGAIDTAATYRVSRNGGTSWRTVTMSRVDGTDTFVGSHEFEDSEFPTTISIHTLSTGGTSALSSVGNQKMSQPFTITGTKVIKQLDNLTLAKTSSSAAGYVYFEIYSDNAGNPGDMIAVSEMTNLADLAMGENVMTIGLEAVLAAGTYHLVVSTTEAYTTGLEVLIGNNPSPPISMKFYNGTTWTANAGYGIQYELNGRSLGLIVDVTAGTNDVELVGLGLFYGMTAPVLTSAKNVEVFKFSGDANTYEFALTTFKPNPDALKVYDVNTGKVYRYGAFTISGSNIVFQNGQFLSPGETITLMMDQSEGGGFDNSDDNANLLAENRLGSRDPGLDRSASGEGILLRASNGTLVEVAVKWNGTSYELEIAEVT